MNTTSLPLPLDTLPPGTPEEEAGPAEAPVHRTQRLPTLDVLRGVALLGILMLNISDFAGSEALWDIPVGLLHPAFIGWHAGLDYAIVLVDWLFAEGRMRSLFSMLFGAGVILLTERLERRGSARQAAGIYYRRNLWLLFFGLCHGFILFFGDILVDYAVMALLFLYPLRRLRTRTLLILGLSVWLVGGTFGSVRAFDVAATLTADTQLTAARAAGTSATPAQRALLQAAAVKQQTSAADMNNTIRQGRLGFLEGWPTRAAEEITILKLKFASLWVLEWLGAMITGMGLYRSGFLTNQRPRREYIRLAVVGYALVFPLVLNGLWRVYQSGYDPAVNARWLAIPYTVTVLAGTFANLSLLLLLLRSDRLRRLFHPLAAVGRTAFSNYILTTVLCQFLFAWSPWKLFGKLEFYQWYLVVAGIWALNLTLSTLWLRLFAFGPLEWLWRSLTYWRRLPLLVTQIQPPIQPLVRT